MSISLILSTIYDLVESFQEECWKIEVEENVNQLYYKLNEVIDKVNNINEEFSNTHLNAAKRSLNDALRSMNPIREYESAITNLKVAYELSNNAKTKCSIALITATCYKSLDESKLVCDYLKFGISDFSSYYTGALSISYIVDFIALSSICTILTGDKNFIYENQTIEMKNIQLLTDFLKKSAKALGAITLNAIKYSINKNKSKDI